MSISGWSTGTLLDFLKNNLQRLQRPLYDLNLIRPTLDDATFTGDLTAEKAFLAGGLITGSSGLHIKGDAIFSDTVRISGSLVTGGLITGSSGLHIKGDAIFGDTVRISGSLVGLSSSGLISGSSGLHPGKFQAYICTSPDNREAALQGLLKEIQVFVEKGPTEEELTLAKEYLTGSFVFDFQSTDR